MTALVVALSIVVGCVGMLWADHRAYRQRIERERTRQRHPTSHVRIIPPDEVDR